jgi:pimeloyl-ACP methyl ester carboxylesterase
MSGRNVTTMAAVRHADRAPIDVGALARVTCPVLILNGNGDRIAGSARRLAAAIPGARIARVTGNHFSAVGHPAFRAAMIEFLSS